MGAAHNEICPYGQVKSLRGENFSANVKCSLRERGQISFHIERSEIFHSVRENVISRFTKVKHFTLLKATQSTYGAIAPTNHRFASQSNLRSLPCE